MAFPVANVVVATDTFLNWVTRTNQLADLMTFQVITANSLSTGAVTTGNAFVNGIFSAQTFAVNVSLRGGNVNTTANLSIISNANFTGASINVASNSAFRGANVYVNSASFNVVGGLANVTSNVSVVTSNSYTSAAQTYIAGGTLQVTSNVTFTQNTVTFTTTNLSHTGNSFTTGANVSITGAVHAISGNLNVDSGALFVDGATNRVGLSNTAPDATLAVTGTANVSGAVRLASTLSVIGATTVNGAVIINNTASISNTLTVTGNATFSNQISVANTITLNTDYVIQVASNTNLGATVGTPVTVFTFPKASYKVAKIISQVISASNANTQGNEMILAHNDTDSTITIYGTVASPVTANLGVFSTTTDATNVILQFSQTAASSKVKLVAQFLKV